MSNDTTFITNQNEETLYNRFSSLIKDTEYFDVLVGYFYTSGFKTIYKSLESTKKIRILIGISTNYDTYNLIEKIQSNKEIAETFGNEVKREMDTSDNTLDVEEGVQKFLDWLESGKLEIKAYPDGKIHSKLYIMTFDENDRDLGRVITGSSNFTKNGLIDNLEFNIELKNSSDYEYAKEKFEELWKSGVDVSENYIETVKKKTWLRDDITPYELYLKFLYEYFREEINEDMRLDFNYRPDNFKEFQYQEHAVIDAKKIIEEYGGVFLSDVVGLGKTYMGTMLAQELPGKTLVIAPPHLIDEDNQGSWENSFRSFGFRANSYKCRSLGILDKIIEKREHKEYDNVLIDESHRFRTEDTETYKYLAQICRGKKVILVTATPYNNSPNDLLSQIKLFQRPRKSTIPNLPDLEGFFKRLEKNLSGLDRKKDKDKYLEVTKENSRLIREKVLQYLMVRRTRKEIEKYYKDDLSKQGMKFPEIADPKAIFYQFNQEESDIFYKTIETITNKFKYARYTPLLYFKGDLGSDAQRQKNMMKFMRMLLVKRLESSFYAFRKSISRFINSYEAFINEFDNGNVYVSKEHTNRIFEYLGNDDQEAIEHLLGTEKAERYESKKFTEKFIIDLRSDLEILKEIQNWWEQIVRDPKIETFIASLSEVNSLSDNKLIVFTESTETAEYIRKNIKSALNENVLLYTGTTKDVTREIVLNNFDANTKNKSNDFRILVTTDVLAEGINLHQANVVVNYDIPWNPTKIMQRVGRINRVDTSHDKIYTYTFFPTDESNDQIKLQESAESKIAAFISLLGSDSKLLTENEEIEAHSLFNRLMAKETIEGEEEVESELKYLSEIRKLRDEDPKLFGRIKKLPKKARSAKSYKDESNMLLTYMRKGKLQKFLIVKEEESSIAEEIDFFKAAKLLKASASTKRGSIDKAYYSLLDKNKEMLEKITGIEDIYIQKRNGRNHSERLLRILKSKQIRSYTGYTEDDDIYINKVITELESGSIPKRLAREINESIEANTDIIANPLKVIGVIRSKLPEEFTESLHVDSKSNEKRHTEVILSEYLISK